MNKISLEDALGMFSKWKSEHPQLQITLLKPDGTSGGTPVEITRISGQDSAISVTVVVNGQPATWEISLVNCIFEFGASEDYALFPEFATKVWEYYLVITGPSKTKYLFAQLK